MKTRVRMYRQGLGDCFLLTFDIGGARPRHVLIDAGVILGGSAELMRKALDDVRAEAERVPGAGLDVVVTHEHWDHVSGFVQAEDAFRAMTIESTWLAWTEDPGDPQATQLRESRAARLNGLQVALTAWGAALGANPASNPGYSVASDLLGLFGAAGRTTKDALDVARSLGKTRRYLEPGNTFLLPEAGVRVYVLGPPRDARFLKKDLPSRRHAETYELAARGGPETAFASGATEPRSDDRFQPFDNWQRRAMSEVNARYSDASEAWRRIDSDWLAFTEEFALQLDSDTNNTSLVLAFELSPGGKVILMAADAQVGNWLSWGGVRFTVPGAKGDVTTADLLSRTVLYKVGHHGSHNATLRDEGLERMTSPELVAMLPVDAAMAEKKRWNMPFPSLFARLKERARDRVLRIDDGIPSGVSVPGAAATDLYVDYVIEHDG